MEKTLRVLGGGDESSGNSHSHSHSRSHDANLTAETTAVRQSVSENGLRSRKGERTKEPFPEPAKAASGPSKLSAYLNLFGDFVHNM